MLEEKLDAENLRSYAEATAISFATTRARIRWRGGKTKSASRTQGASGPIGQANMRSCFACNDALGWTQTPRIGRRRDETAVRSQHRTIEATLQIA